MVALLVQKMKAAQIAKSVGKAARRQMRRSQGLRSRKERATRAIVAMRQHRPRISRGVWIMVSVLFSPGSAPLQGVSLLAIDATKVRLTPFAPAARRVGNGAAPRRSRPVVCRQVRSLHWS